MSYVVLMKSQDSSFHSRFHGDNKLSIPRSDLSASSLGGVDLRAPLPSRLLLFFKGGVHQDQCFPVPPLMREETTRRDHDYRSAFHISCGSHQGLFWGARLLVIFSFTTRPQRREREERRAPGSLSTSREVRTLTTHRVSSSLPFFPFARAKGGRDYRRMDSWCTFLFLLAFEGEEKMKDAPGK